MNFYYLSAADASSMSGVSDHEWQLTHIVVPAVTLTTAVVVLAVVTTVAMIGKLLLCYNIKLLLEFGFVLRVYSCPVSTVHVQSPDLPQIK